MLCGENVQRKRLEMRLIYQLRTSHPRSLDPVSSRLTREHGICKHCNVSYELSNSTDEGPGPKRLEKISNQNMALLFIIFLFLLLLNIPLLTSKAPRSLSEFFFSVSCLIRFFCRFKLVRRTSRLYWMAFHIVTKNPPSWYKHLFTLSRRVAQQPGIRYGNDPVSWSVRRSFVMFNIETAPRPPFFCCVNRSAIRYGFRAGVRAIW